MWKAWGWNAAVATGENEQNGLAKFDEVVSEQLLSQACEAVLNLEITPSTNWSAGQLLLCGLEGCVFWKWPSFMLSLQ
jgi:hypothetical protein